MDRLRERDPSFLGKAAIVSTGYTALSKQSGTTVLSLATEACGNALTMAGVDPAEIDGIVSYSLFDDSVACQAVATAMAVPQLTYALDMNMGGVAPALCVMHAAMDVA